MGSNSLKGWIEVIVFAVVAVILALFPISIGNYGLALGILPLVFISLRRGLLQGLFSGALAGILLLLFKEGSPDFTGNIITQFGPLAFIGISGLFAKFTQRTLNNKRYSNAALNIVTASFFGTLLYYIWMMVGSLFFRTEAPLNESNSFAYYFEMHGVSFLISFAVTAVLLLLLAKVAPKTFIPRDTPFLSRKEKSRLLND